MRKDFLMPLRRIHGWLHEFPSWRKMRKHVLNSDVPAIKERLRQEPNSVFLVMTPEHRNLGDHAIASAEVTLLNSLNISYIEISDTQLNKLYRTGLLSIFNGHPIIINGGGNMGTLWYDAELTHRGLIANNPKSDIFIFPNTIYYEDTDWGRNEFKKSIKIYNRHQKLHLYAREKISYNCMKKAYHNVTLMPDIAFLLNKSDDCNYKRHGCLLCLRKDLECTRTAEQNEEILNQVKILFGEDIAVTDTLAEQPVTARDREINLSKKYNELKKASLVITDRLHGMIFCAITGTPCIVLESKSPKVRGCYEWIKHLEYIRFADRPEDIATEYRLIPKGSNLYDNSHLMHYYQQIAEDIKGIWR